MHNNQSAFNAKINFQKRGNRQKKMILLTDYIVYKKDRNKKSNLSIFWLNKNIQRFLLLIILSK